MRALALLIELQRQGVKFINDGGRLKVVSPKSVALPQALKNEIRRRKDEILHRLRAGDITAEDVVEVFPGSVDITAAMSWLKAKLSTPQHIADVITEWVGTVDRPTGRDVDDLLQVRWALKVEAYTGKDTRMWWRLPQRSMQ
jgi:hypothetical protein